MVATTLRLTLVLLLLCCAVFAGEGKRSFIGIKMGYKTAESYEARQGAQLIFFDAFDNNELHTAWKPHGSIEFYESAGNLNVPVRSRKRLPKEGSLTLDKQGSDESASVDFRISQTIPLDNQSLVSSIFFTATPDSFDSLGHPASYIRFFKRSQMEFLEVKEKNSAPRLIWGRNAAVVSGKVRDIVLNIDQKNVSLIIDTEPLFSGPHGFFSVARLVPGIWISTKGQSLVGGNIVYDNAILETVHQEEAQ